MDHVKTGLNKNKPVDRAVMVAIDLLKAFNTVDHEILLNDIAELPQNSNLKLSWLATSGAARHTARFIKPYRDLVTKCT